MFDRLISPFLASVTFGALVVLSTMLFSPPSTTPASFDRKVSANSTPASPSSTLRASGEVASLSQLTSSGAIDSGTSISGSGSSSFLPVSPKTPAHTSLLTPAPNSVASKHDPSLPSNGLPTGDDQDDDDDDEHGDEEHGGDVIDEGDD